MKLVAFLAILAFAAAGPVQKSIAISTPEKIILISQSEDYKTNVLPERNDYGLNGQQYFPQGTAFQVAQYIAYLFHQAQQNGYQVAELNSQLTKQGFPQFVVQYFSEKYEGLKTQPFEKSPYETFQYYYEQDVPKEVQQYIVEQIAQAYQHYQQYRFKNEQPVFEEYRVIPLSVGQYVNEQAKYYKKNVVSYPLFQYTFLQLQDVQQNIQNIIEGQEYSNLPQYQHFIQQLKQGQQYIQNAYKVYQAYQSYQQYYVPYYVAEYFFHQVQEASQYFQNAYQYIQQQQVLGNSPQVDIFQQVQSAYLTLQKVYHIYQQSQFESTYLGYNNEFSFAYVEYVAKHLQLAQQYIEKTQELLQLQVDQNNAPESFVSDVLKQLKLVQNYEQNAYESLQQAYGSQIPQYTVQQAQQALHYLQNVYQAILQRSLGVDVIKQIEYALQYTQNAYFAARQATYQGIYPRYASYKPTYAQGYNLRSYQAVQQIQRYIQAAQEYVQSNLPQATLIAQQLAKSYQVYQQAEHLFQQGYLPQTIVQYAKQQVQQAYQYLFNAYQTAQQQEVSYVAQQLQYALQLARYLQYADVYQTTQYQPSFLSSYGNQHEFDYRYENVNQNRYQQPYQYAEQAQQYVQKLYGEGVIPQKYANYIVQQLQEAQKYSGPKYKFGSQYYNGIYNFGQQIQQYYQNVYQYIQQHAASGDIPQYAAEYLSQLINAAQQNVQKTYLPYQQQQYYGQKYPSNDKQGYIQSFLKNYFNKNSQYLGKSDYQGQDQLLPYDYGYYGTYSSLPYQYEPTGNEYYGSYSPYSSKYGSYQYGSYGIQKDNSFYNPYKYETYSQGSYPYGYINAAYYKQSTAGAA